VAIIEAKEERERRAAFEAESDKKREALRRTQQAAAEARRRAEEMERQRREAEYLAQFGELPPSDDAGADAADSSNAPGAVYEPADGGVLNQPYDEEPAVDGSNAPTVDTSPEPVPEGDLDAVREELRRRAEESEEQ
jgi:hypothetical protein